MVRVLVTGGAGYIGSHTAKLLESSGFMPVVLDNFSMGHRWAVRGAPLVEADLQDTECVTGALRSHGIEAVIHFAAKACVGESMADPQLYFQNNVVGTLSLLAAMREAGVRRLVFSSTCAVYGEPVGIPIREDHPQRPLNPYGDSKLFIERVLGWYGHAYGLEWVALRYFNAAGADEEGELGEHHNPETHLIPLAIEAALGWRDALDLFGIDYPTPDGTAIRDYIHVSDLAAAHVAALRHLAGGGASGAFNLGAERGHSVREVLAAVEEATGRAAPFRAAPRRPGDPAVLVADATRARDILHWRPERSELASIVRSATRWHATGPR